MRRKATTCRLCGAPRREDVGYALCAEHYRIYARRQTRKRRGMDPDAPIKVVDTSKCRLCDQPRLHYGVLCRQCFNADQRRKSRNRGQVSWAEHLARIAVTKRVCATGGCGEPSVTRKAKYCKACAALRRKQVLRSSRAKMAAAAKSPLKQIPRLYPDVKVGPEAIAQPKPVVPPGTVQRIPAADAAEREAREREWAKWLERRRQEND